MNDAHEVFYIHSHSGPQRAAVFNITRLFLWCAVIFSIGAVGCLVVIVISILERTTYWKDALIFLGLGVLSYALGIFTIMARNYFLGYYSR